MAFIRVALDVPLATLFDYRMPGATPADIGARVVVPFRRKIATGIILGIESASVLPPQRIRTALRILRDVPPLPVDVLKLTKFCSDYYQYPIGATILGTLPLRLRQTRPIKPPPDAGTAASGADAAAGPALSAEQRHALKQIRAGHGFVPWLLRGVTGSGKTEVYFHLVADALARGKQALLLVPEINLTPQLEAQIAARFPATPLATLHSALNESERLHNWLAAQSGRAGIVLGTRLAVFAPLPRLGLIVVDEEHDTSFKQAEGLRYSARDVAVLRAKQREILVVLGSATPSLESYQQALAGRYRQLVLSRRIHAELPSIECIDTRRAALIDGLSQPLLAALHATLKRGGQSLIFINRRGYSPVLMCRSCGWTSDCRRCSAKLVLHLQEHLLRCHHCGHTEPAPAACPQCGDQDLLPVGQGTQRIEAALARMLPGARILRIDRDSTRRKHAWREMREQIQSQQIDILVGTQILAKGHDFPRITLVGVLNADGALYSTDFRAGERLYARLAQVAGRAGRGEHPGRVLVQTDFPDHPLYRALCRDDYAAFAETQLAERRQAGLPPFVHQAALRAEAPQLATALDFLARAAASGSRIADGVTLLDAVPAAVTRRAGIERAHLVVESRSRRALQDFLFRWRQQLEAAAVRKVRWMIEVDPLEL
ncbi:MAG TPA: primosomal protein N' [Burkholderiales bacterium]|nr:primosomal protein N' [Burkholderiales bacterium]